MAHGTDALPTEPAEVLVVKDEVLTSMMVEDALVEAGYVLRGSACTEDEAYDLCAGSAPTLAVIDVNLGPGGSGINVGRILAARGTLVLFASADCPNQCGAMAAAGAVACMGKPYDAANVALALELIRLLHDGRAIQVPTWLHVLTTASS